MHSLNPWNIDAFVNGVKTDDYEFYDKYIGVKEVVLIGSTNSGKSTLINALNDGVEVAKVAKRTGKTQALNFYLAHNKVSKGNKMGFVVDTPGYGYAVAPAKLRTKWKPMMFKYLGFGVRINLILMLVNG